MKSLKWLGFFLVMIIAGCTTTRVTTSWKAVNAVPKEYNKIMVLGLIREADRTLQENMENHLVADLKELGYNAVSSLREYGPKAFDKIDEEKAIGKLKSSGVDAVITIVMLDKQKERNYIPGHTYYSPYGHYYSRFWGYRITLYNRIDEPGYYAIDTRYFWESNLYDMSTQSLVYSVQTQSFDPSNSESLGHEYGQLIVNDMVKNNIITKKSNLPVKAF